MAKKFVQILMVATSPCRGRLPDAAIHHGYKGTGATMRSTSLFSYFVLQLSKLCSANFGRPLTKSSSAMAPNQPPRSPPKDPRLSQSSSSYKVQKRPTPIVSPRLHSSGRSEAIRGADRTNTIASSICTDDNEDWTSRVSSESEGDEHTTTQVDLSMLRTALEESIRDSHNELENRVSKGERSPLLDQVSQHLLVSPPSSPDSLNSEGSLPSPASKKRIAQSRMKGLDELMKRDADLHNMMHDLAGIREWWTGNKQAWYEMREKIRGLDNQISDLQTQAEQHYQMIGTKRSHLRQLYGSTVGFIDERWAPQIEELKEQREINLAWFEENRGLMKKVWARVQDIADTVYLDSKANKKLGSSYPATHDISNLLWFQREDKGLKWWLRQARKDVETLRDRIQNLLDSDHARVESRALEHRKLEGQLKFWQDAFQEGDIEADMQISELRQNQRKGYNIEIRQIMNARQIARVDEFREEYDVKEMIKDLQLRDQESILMRKILTDIFERNRRIRQRLNEISRYPPNIRPAGHRSDICFYTDIYHLVRHHIHRTIQGLNLGTSLDQVSYSQTKRKKIVARIKDYPESDTEAFFLDFVARWGPRNAPVDHEALGSLTADSRREALYFTTMVKDCQEIITEQEPAFRTLKKLTHPAAYLLPKICNVTLKKTPPNSPFDLARTMGSTIPLITCQFILEQPPKEPTGTHADTHYPWYKLLRDFMTSPDIFPLFRSNTYAGGRRSWNKEEFFTNINSLLKTPVDHHILEAFLSYCSHTNDLFRMTEFMRRIEVIPEGWELCEENPVQGLYRKVPASSLPRPRGIDRLEHVLCVHWREIGCENSDREIAEEDLRKFLNSALPNDDRISKDSMRQAVSYWSNVGQFFVLVNP